jgi:hypothetical protein
MFETSSPVSASLFPAGSSWLNLMERWFGRQGGMAICCGVSLSAADLQASSEAFLKARSREPQPFVWTATVKST